MPTFVFGGLLSFTATSALVVKYTVFQIIVWVRVTGHERSLRAARSLLFHTFLMDESRSDSEKLDKKEKSDDYDSPSDLWSVF